MTLLTLLRSLIAPKLKPDPRFSVQAIKVHAATAIPAVNCVDALPRCHSVQAVKNHAKEAPSRVYEVEA